jgi:hypothetical protein
MTMQSNGIFKEILPSLFPHSTARRMGSYPTYYFRHNYGAFVGFPYHTARAATL